MSKIAGNWSYSTQVISTGDPGFSTTDTNCCTSPGARGAPTPQQYPVDQTAGAQGKGAGCGCSGGASAAGGRGRRGCKCWWIALAVVVLLVAVK